METNLYPAIVKGGGGKNGSHHYCARIGPFRGRATPVGATVVDAPMGELAIRWPTAAEMAAASGDRLLTAAGCGGSGGQWRFVAGAEWRGMKVCAAGRSALGAVAVAGAVPQPEVPLGLTVAVGDVAGGLMRWRPAGADWQRRQGASVKPTDDGGAGVKPIDGRGAGIKSTDERDAGSKPTDGRGAGIKPTDDRGAGSKSTDDGGTGVKPTDGQDAGKWVSFIRSAAAGYTQHALIRHALTPQIRSDWDGGVAYGFAADAGREVFGNGE